MKSVIAFVIVLAVAGGLYALYSSNREPLPASYVTPSGTYATPGTTVSHSLIRVTSPLAGATISSPVTITGEARGNWYFEASFPVKILDANGKELGVSYAQAQGEWMTTDFVPFRSTLTFSTPTTPTGTLVLEKDNPSGLPENADEIRIPVKFSAQSAQTRAVKLYFYNDNLDKDPAGNILCSSKGLVAVTRTVPLTNTPIQDAVKELLKGPTAAEKAAAPNSATPESEFPLAGVSLNAASLSNGILTLTFSDPQNKTSGGSCRVSVLRAQIEATAKQFGGVTSVRLAPAAVFQP